MSNSKTKPMFINTEMSAAIQSALKAGDRAKRAMGKFADLMVAQFGTDAVEHLISYKTKGSLATEESWATLNAVIDTTFPDSAQTLLARPITSMSDPEKKKRGYWQRQRGSKQKDLRNAVKTRLGEDQPKEPKAPRSPETRIRDAAQDIVKVCENIESPTFRPAEIKALAEQIIRSI
jgi:hypothetical protein